MTLPELYHFEAEVIGEPQRTVEQRISGSGGLSGHIVSTGDRNHVVVPSGSFSIGTEYRYRCDFWARIQHGSEIGEVQIVLDRQMPPVREGQKLAIIFAYHGSRRPVPVGFVNRTSGKHHRLRSAENLLQYFRLPVEESWREVEPASPEALVTHRRRLLESKKTGSLFSLGALCTCGLGFAFTIVGLAKKAGFAIGAGIFILVVAVILGVVAFVYMSGTHLRRPRSLEIIRYRDYADRFDRRYEKYVDSIWQSPPLSIP
jgi:hypothetical protein